MTEIWSLPVTGAEQLDKARDSSSGRSALTISGGRHRLRQTIIALTKGASLADHDSPGDATLQVVTGRIRLEWADGELILGETELATIPPQRHSLLALADAVVLLTIAR
ncbi:LuxR family transcriptional regulator [Stackebrandtia soli]